MNARLAVRLAKIEIGLAILLGYSIVALDANRAELRALTRNPEAGREIVAQIQEKKQDDSQGHDAVHWESPYVLETDHVPRWLEKKVPASAAFFDELETRGLVSVS